MPLIITDGNYFGGLEFGGKCPPDFPICIHAIEYRVMFLYCIYIFNSKKKNYEVHGPKDYATYSVY